jgi:hypothetical protein
MDLIRSGDFTMKTMIARISLVLLILVLAFAPTVARSQKSADSTDDLTLDQKKAAAARKKADDAAAKKTAEEQKKAGKKSGNEKDVDAIGNRDINKGFKNINFSSIQKDIQMGKAASVEVESTVQLINDRQINEYVNRLGQNLVRNSDATQFTFTFKVVDSDEINAFALPGGFAYVNSGLILAADDEAELAGVIAHEIGHVAARHASENNSKGTLLQALSIPAIIMTGGVAGTAIQQGLQLAIPLGMFHFSKGAEKEADLLGLEYMYKAGYDPAATISFFEKLQAKESPRKVNSLFSTHPPTADRVAIEKKNIETILKDKDEYIVTTSEFDKIKARLANLDVHKPVERQGPSLQRGKQGGGRTRPDPNDDDTHPSTRPDDRAPGGDDRPVLKRSDPTPDPTTDPAAEPAKP